MTSRQRGELFECPLATETSKIDVSHEAFIREWETFGKWLADERNLATSFVDLKRQYLDWQSQIADHSSSPLRRLWTRCFGGLASQHGDIEPVHTSPIDSI